jgi:hypothetical protein
MQWIAKIITDFMDSSVERIGFTVTFQSYIIEQNPDFFVTLLCLPR